MKLLLFRSVLCLENALHISPKDENLKKLKHAVLCHAHLESALEKQLQWVRFRFTFFFYTVKHRRPSWPKLEDREKSGLWKDHKWRLCKTVSPFVKLREEGVPSATFPHQEGGLKLISKSHQKKSTPTTGLLISHNRHFFKSVISFLNFLWAALQFDLGPFSIRLSRSFGYCDYSESLLVLLRKDLDKVRYEAPYFHVAFSFLRIFKLFRGWGWVSIFWKSYTYQQHLWCKILRAYEVLNLSSLRNAYPCITVLRYISGPCMNAQGLRTQRYLVSQFR